VAEFIENSGEFQEKVALWVSWKTGS
jgi:hypothetical protein